MKFCNRPQMSDAEKKLASENPRGDWTVSAASVLRHDADLIDGINSCVKEEDTLWILGDFCMGRYAEAAKIRERIVCKDLRLIWGNHDHRSIESLFSATAEQTLIKINGQKIFLNHYPMRYWDASFRGSWHLYGHVHARLELEDIKEDWRLTKDVGVDACDYRPVNFEQISEYMQPRIPKFEARVASGKMN